MIKLICSILFFFYTPFPACAIELLNSYSSLSDSSEINIPNEQSRTAIQLAVSDFLTFKSLKVNLILKRQFTEELALRIGLYLNFKYTKCEGGSNNAYSGYGSNLLVQYYFITKKRFSAYVIGGLQYDYEEYDYDEINYPDKLYSYGIGGGMGAEYFFLSSMSLFAEFSTALAYEVQKKKFETGYESYGNVSFRNNSVSLGFSVYF